MSKLKRRFKKGLYILRTRGPVGLVAAGGKRLVQPRLSFAEKEEQMLALPTAKERFSKIYEDNLWGGVDSFSGQGSNLRNTRKLREALPGLVTKYGIHSMVDAPCGDFAWMRLILPELKIDYTGADIVGTVIETNQKSFATNTVRFIECDICSDPIPPADLIFVRDCLFHLSFEEIGKFLRNLAATEYKYLMTTSHEVQHRGDFRNTDIRTGEFRLIDLFSTPFDFQRDSVLEDIEDFEDRQHPRSMVLIAKDNVPTDLAISDPDQGPTAA